MFHAPPETGRVVDHPTLGSTVRDGANGAWDLPSSEPGWRLALIICDGVSDPDASERWEHVSVHAYKPVRKGMQVRIPTWREMCYVKALCWDEEDVVIQYHPRKQDYVNQHPCVLHLWRPVDAVLPTPPPEFVGTHAGREQGAAESGGDRQASSE
jgi:hypothetical protein